MTTATLAELSAADVAEIAQAIGDGFAAVNNWPGVSAGGAILPDHAREYWARLPDARVARVTVYRRPDGHRWTVAGVCVFEDGHPVNAIDHDAAGEILAAVAADCRTIAR